MDKPRLIGSHLSCIRVKVFFHEPHVLATVFCLLAVRCTPTALFGGEGRAKELQTARWFLGRVAISFSGQNHQISTATLYARKNASKHKLNKLGSSWLGKQEKRIQVEKGREPVNPMSNSGNNSVRNCSPVVAPLMLYSEPRMAYMVGPLRPSWLHSPRQDGSSCFGA